MNASISRQVGGWSYPKGFSTVHAWSFSQLQVTRFTLLPKIVFLQLLFYTSGCPQSHLCSYIFSSAKFILIACNLITAVTFFIVQCQDQTQGVAHGRRVQYNYSLSCFLMTIFLVHVVCYLLVCHSFLRLYLPTQIATLSARSLVHQCAEWLLCLLAHGPFNIP